MGMTHTLSILKIKDLRLVAIVDSDVEGIEKKIKAESGNFSTGEVDPDIIKRINKYPELSECLNNETLDAVHICVHTDLHYDFAKQALENGKHVFLEKPMTLDIDKGQTLIDIAARKGLILMVGHVLRFMPPYEKLKSWIDKEAFGKLNFLSLSRFSGLPAWGQWKEKRADFGSTGGALFDLLIHDIDFAQYVLGIPDNIQSNILPGSLSNHDYIDALWSYKNRDLAVKVEGGNIFHTSFPFQAGYVAGFEKASIVYSTAHGDVIKIANHDEIKEVEAGDANEGFYNEIAYFSHCMNHGKAPVACLPESALETIKLCYKHI
jgi:predicted dehydrogenase